MSTKYVDIPLSAGIGEDPARSVATAARQDVTNSSLASIDSKVATQAAQIAGNASLSSIDLKLTKYPDYGATVQIVGGTNITDLFTISGSADKIVKIERITFQGSAGANAVIDVHFIKRSAPNSGGTFTLVSALPYDSTSAASSVVVRAYTANPTSLGTAIGTFCIRKCFLNGSNSNPSEPLILDLPFVLRGANEQLAINLAGYNNAADNYVVCVEWTEE